MGKKTVNCLSSKRAISRETGDDILFLPFWRIQADVTSVRLKTYADLIKLANLPKVARPGWDKIPFYFWNPAFKVRPQSYLTIAANVTLNQPAEKAVAGHPRWRHSKCYVAAQRGGGKSQA